MLTMLSRIVREEKKKQTRKIQQQQLPIRQPDGRERNVDVNVKYGFRLDIYVSNYLRGIASKGGNSLIRLVRGLAKDQFVIQILSGDVQLLRSP